MATPIFIPFSEEKDCLVEAFFSGLLLRYNQTQYLDLKEIVR